MLSCMNTNQGASHREHDPDYHLTVPVTRVLATGNATLITTFYSNGNQGTSHPRDHVQWVETLSVLFKIVCYADETEKVESRDVF